MACRVRRSHAHVADIATPELRLLMPVHCARLELLLQIWLLFYLFALLVLQEDFVLKDPLNIWVLEFAELVHTLIQDKESLRSVCLARAENIVYRTRHPH